jgi:hypothetical protein
VGCIGPNETVYIRVWSSAGDSNNWQDGEGTFRIAIFPRKYIGTKNATVLWGDQPGQGDFAFGLNDWTAMGISCNGTGPENALWTWGNTGWPYWLFGGHKISRIMSKTLCNGVMTFESTFLDIGPDAVSGSGTCPQEHEGALVSPLIDLSGFNSPGVSVLFNQSMLRFIGGHHFVDFSLDGGQSWIENEINTEKNYFSNDPLTGTGYYNEEYLVRLPGAENVPDLRIRFRFQGGKYWWIIDDVRIIETECNNDRLEFSAIAPFAQIPNDQVYPFAALSDIQNIGVCGQTHVGLNHTVQNTTTNEIIYDQTLNYVTIDAPDTIQNQIFPMLINLPKVDADYRGTYTLTQDSVDFNPLDNIFSFRYHVGGDTFALEDGATRKIAVNPAIYNDGAPLSYAYGNYFRPIKDVEVDYITWGVSNATAMIGKTVTIYLLQWTDTNSNQIAEKSERRYIGVKDYTFTGTEADNVLLNTVLENFDNPEDPVIMKAGIGYIAIVEYVANVESNTEFFMLASEDRDYSAQQLAMKSAYALGLSGFPMYFSVLGFSADGNLTNVDYEVTPLPLPHRFFGNAIVPVVRVVTKHFTNTKDELPPHNLVTVYPNPVYDKVQVRMEFAKPFRNIHLKLINNLGQTVFSKTLPNTITSHIETINVSSFASGNYILQVETPDGQRLIPIIVVR